jgi:restriction endonuclease Mrr
MTPFGYLLFGVVGVLVVAFYKWSGEQQEEANRRLRECIEEQQKKEEAERKRAAEEWERQRQEKLELEAREKWRIHYQYRSIREIERMSGLEFEQFLAGLFAKLGYTAIQLTPVNDQGGDVICKSPSGVRTVIQAKRWSKPLGNNVVQEVLGAMLHYDCEAGLVVTNSVFTPAAIELASKEKRIKLHDVRWLERTMNKHIAVEIPDFSWVAYKELATHGLPTVLEKQKAARKRQYYRRHRRWR